MDSLLHIAPVSTLVLAFAVTFVAGIVKGTVGFAMPTVMISGLSAVLSPELALAALIVPTMITNGWQALRQGVASVRATVVKFRVLLCFGVVFLVTFAKLVPVLPSAWLFLAIGVPISVFAVLQIMGWRGQLAQRVPWIEALAGSFAGIMGGLSGVFAPPTVAYLTAIDTPKTEQMQIQGTIYGLGAAALVGAHLQSGVLRAETVPLSIAMVVPALLGMFVGLKIQDRIDQAMFRKATLVVLVLAGLNLIRRGLMG